MKTTLFYFILFFFTNAFLCNGADWEAKDLITYYGYTSKPITIEWDAAQCSSGVTYEVRLRSEEKEVFEQIQTTDTTEITLNIPRTGHYTIYVRAKNVDTDEYGDWANSTQATLLTNESLKPFWVYGYIEPVGEIIIN